MSIFSWFGKKIGLTDPGFWRAYYGTETWAGESVTPETALQVSAFWACVRLISQTIGTLPLGIYERQADGARITRGDLPLYRLLHDQPNADQTAVEFWEGVVACLCLSGNAFAEKSMGLAGLVALTLLSPDRVSVERTETGKLRYRYRDQKGIERVIPEERMFHVRGFGVGGDLGLSPVSYARQSLSAARATDKASASVFANGLRPSGFLMYKGGNLSDDQRKQIREALITPLEGAENAGKTGILAADLFDYRQITIPPKDAELLESKRLNIEIICQWLGVPPILVGHSSPGQTMFGAGVEQVILGWLTLGLRPYLTRIEQSVKRSLLLPEERGKLYAEFAVEGLLRADSAGRAEMYWKMVQIAAMTPNQVCDKENMPRFEGGDVHLLNQTLIPLELAGKVPEQQPVGAEAGQRPKLELVKP